MKKMLSLKMKIIWQTEKKNRSVRENEEELFCTRYTFQALVDNCAVQSICDEAAIPTVCCANFDSLDIVRTVYHLVIYMQSNKMHKVFINEFTQHLR